MVYSTSGGKTWLDKKKNSNRRKGSQPKGFKKEAKAPRPKYTPESSLNEQESTDFVYGRHAVREALQQPERVNKLWVQEALSGKEITPIIDLAKNIEFKFKMFRKLNYKILLEKLSIKELLLPLQPTNMRL